MIDERGLFIFDLKSRRSGAFELRSDIVSESDSSINVENECCNSDPYFSGSILPFSAICDNYKKVLKKGFEKDFRWFKVGFGSNLPRNLGYLLAAELMK